ncbi:asparagine synthase (glutamine-hydrolyzing) [Pullulanibacillus pueri]|uniref:asparagine synthase (glutamine-hydrolyzing) n=1 Tax=Pullulanibacillus pueri TaxID=1437324 RepID=A0A8J2ZUT1_9BACL|nr:asparagine synthase (glutamine-hydrolyzing) [Pullulanibacillus pueri]MBM7681225.1 asparagine synthase (glutamine-hydrolyzing) [Pullulanibacillus pueri]GGH77971.1 asparagine synthetase B [Pullulanibacillus pueri]
MCGIAGWIDWEKDLSEQHAVLRKMTASITHRGPDSEGFWLSRHAALGHRRLIVIAPEAGEQPMVYEHGNDKIVLTYNGELYNYRELRKELQEKGHVFQSLSDTEVVLHAYLEWQEDCVTHFNGIFAFGIWDEKVQRLMLGRDHLGVKPLFYTQVGHSVIFGSEIKVLLSHSAVHAEVDREGLAEIFGMGPIRTPGQAVFKGIKEVRAGHYALFTSSKKVTHPYWQLKSQPHTDDVDTTVSKIRTLLEDTVRHQLIADKPLVSMLSGGLDSSGLTAIAGQEYKEKGKRLHTYSIDFVNYEADFKEDFLRRDRDEPWVRKVSEYVGTEHHSIVIGADKLAENLLIPMRARDLPGIGELETSLYLLFKEMKKQATVALSGESADEVFSGYPWFHQPEFLDAETFPWLVNIDFIADVLTDEWKERLQLKAYQKQRYQEALAEVPLLENEDDRHRKQRQMSYMFITRFLTFMLDRKDRASMMTGFEVRVPFCDYRLVEYLWNIPHELKSIDDIEKGILRRALKPYLPDEVRNRRKSGYPSTNDQTYLKAIGQMMVTVLEDPQSPLRRFVKIDRLMQIAQGEDQEITDEQARHVLDYLLQVNAWLKEYEITINL